MRPHTRNNHDEINAGDKMITMLLINFLQKKFSVWLEFEHTPSNLIK